MVNRTLLYSGQMGGKSTFAGGLYSHGIKRDDITTNYQAQIGSEVFEDCILSPLIHNHQYPHQNPEPFIIEIQLNRRSFALPPSTVTVLDIPGEVIGDDRIAQPWEQQQDEDMIRQQYDELNIEQNRIKYKLLENWNVMLAHEYLQSDSLIFLLNIYKLLMTNNPVLSFDADDLITAAQEKNIAVVATGTDVINHQPDEDVGSGGILDYIWRSGSPVDSELLDAINDATTASQVTNILNTVKREDDISFFGVAVPSREVDGDDYPIATENGGVETWGFENVVRWMS